MKVLFYQVTPFMLAHGGLQIQITQTRLALEKLGVNVEFLRWWDSGQSGDILHFFGRLRLGVLRLARGKGLKVVQSELLTEQGSRSPSRLRLEKVVRRILQRGLPRRVTEPFHWDSYREADASVALTEWEASLMRDLFLAPPERVHVVPNGVEDAFFNSAVAQRGAYLVCSATITERKRVLELAQAAVMARTPLWIIGKPYSDSDSYAQQFITLTKAHPEFLRYEGPVADRSRLAQIYREARGFVLLSAMESLSLSALEAAACECPLLLSRLPWATTVFGEHASYCPIAPPPQTAVDLRQFYDAAPRLKPPPKPLGWLDVAAKLKRLYESVLKTSR